MINVSVEPLVLTYALIFGLYDYDNEVFIKCIPEVLK